MAVRAPGDHATKLRSRRRSPGATTERSDTAGRGGRRGQSPQPQLSEQERLSRAGAKLLAGLRGAQAAPERRAPRMCPGAGDSGAALLSLPSPLAISSLNHTNSTAACCRNYRQLGRSQPPARVWLRREFGDAQHRFGMQSRKASGFCLQLGKGGRAQTQGVCPPPSQH